METKEKLDNCIEAEQILLKKIENVKVNLVGWIIKPGDYYEKISNDLELLDTYSKALVEVRSMIPVLENEIEEQKLAKIKPENCINFVGNGGKCFPDTVWSCKYGDCESFVEKNVPVPGEIENVTAESEQDFPWTPFKSRTGKRCR